MLCSRNYQFLNTLRSLLSLWWTLTWGQVQGSKRQLHFCSVWFLSQFFRSAWANDWISPPSLTICSHLSNFAAYVLTWLWKTSESHSLRFRCLAFDGVTMSSLFTSARPMALFHCVSLGWLARHLHSGSAPLGCFLFSPPPVCSWFIVQTCVTTRAVSADASKMIFFFLLLKLLSYSNKLDSHKD